METDESIRGHYRAGLAVNARNALAAIEAHKTFDNNDTKVFGNANWRAVYSTWFPQHTQADALKLSGIADKAKRGERKHYEARYMRNPLAAAAIIASGRRRRGTRCRRAHDPPLRLLEDPHVGVLLRGMRVLRVASQEMKHENIHIEKCAAVINPTPKSSRRFPGELHTSFFYVGGAGCCARVASPRPRCEAPLAYATGRFLRSATQAGHWPRGQPGQGLDSL